MAHNMLAIMFDLCFKNMKVIWYYVRNYFINEIVVKYNMKVVYPIILQIYFYLNHARPLVEITIVEKNGFFFG